MTTRFNKAVPGADQVFQPSNLADYDADAWDIRISIGEAPLDEAYYFTVEDPKARDWSIERLLDELALNPDLKDKLDVGDYPELPYLQDELIQYRQNQRQGWLAVEYYINGASQEGPIRLSQSAKDLLSVCTYHDKSHDYQVLDLVMLPSVPEPSEADISRKLMQYGDLFLLFLFDHYHQQSPKVLQRLMQEEPLASIDAVEPGQSVRSLRYCLDKLQSEGLIEMNLPEDAGGFFAKKKELVLTPRGQQRVEEIVQDSNAKADQYDLYHSVSVYPCALGVPEGFDVRIQMMEYNGLDIEREVLIQILLQHYDELFSDPDWSELFEAFVPYQAVNEALAYKTQFSAEILDILKELAALENQSDTTGL